MNLEQYKENNKAIKGSNLVGNTNDETLKRTKEEQFLLDLIYISKAANREELSVEKIINTPTYEYKYSEAFYDACDNDLSETKAQRAGRLAALTSYLEDLIA